MNNIMLGQEITLNACLLDNYDQPTEAAQFSIAGMNHSDYNISSADIFQYHATVQLKD